MRYLCIGAKGPGFASPEEALGVLEQGILPTFAYLMKLEKEKKILAGGLALGDRRVVFVLEAATNEAADELLRSIPAWGVLDWEITPMVTFATRDNEERAMVKKLKQGK
jgi:hypothetical protein